MAVDTGRPPAMTDVAQLAGVSHQTVSRVINDLPNVRQSTRLRVLAAMQELGYRPNRAARALAKGRSDQIGIVAQPSTLYGPASVLTAVEAAAVRAGYAVSVSSVPALDRASMQDAIERHLEHQVGGIIVIVPVISAVEAIRTMDSGVPVVMIGGDRTLSVPSVGIDQIAGARIATQTLLDAGHHTVWHVSGAQDSFDSLDRIDGWRATLAGAGVEEPPVISGDWSAARGYEAGLMLARMPDVTAVFAANDQSALGILRAFHEHGRRVPGDISVIGFDDLPESGYVIPPLTTLRQDFEKVGRAALKCLLARMVDPQAPAPALITPTLVQRASVAPPPTR